MRGIQQVFRCEVLQKNRNAMGRVNNRWTRNRDSFIHLLNTNFFRFQLSQLERATPLSLCAVFRESSNCEYVEHVFAINDVLSSVLFVHIKIFYKNDLVLDKKSQ